MNFSDFYHACKGVRKIGKVEMTALWCGSICYTLKGNGKISPSVFGSFKDAFVLGLVIRLRGVDPGTSPGG